MLAFGVGVICFLLIALFACSLLQLYVQCCIHTELQLINTRLVRIVDLGPNATHELPKMQLHK